MGWMTCLGWKFPCTTYSNWHPMPFTWWSSTRGVAISSGMDPWDSSNTWTESLCLSGSSTSVATLERTKSELTTGEGESHHGTPKMTSFVCKTILFPEVGLLNPAHVWFRLQKCRLWEHNFWENEKNIVTFHRSKQICLTFSLNLTPFFHPFKTWNLYGLCAYTFEVNCVRC